MLHTHTLSGGEIFYITDGKPVDSGFILDPMNAILTNEKELKFPKPFFILPAKVLLKFATIMEFTSVILGKKFHLPKWALTTMEAYKVNY